MFRWWGRSYGNATWTIANDQDDWKDLDCLDSVEIYPDDWDDCVNFEVIIWKCSQTTGAIGRIKGYPRNHYYSSNWEKIWSGRRWSWKNNAKMFTPWIGTISNVFEELFVNTTKSREKADNKAWGSLSD